MISRLFNINRPHIEICIVTCIDTQVDLDEFYRQINTLLRYVPFTEYEKVTCKKDDLRMKCIFEFYACNGCVVNVVFKRIVDEHIASTIYTIDNRTFDNIDAAAIKLSNCLD